MPWTRVLPVRATIRSLPRAVRESVEVRIKYDGYIKRQNRQVEEFRRLESRKLPADLDYETVTGLRLESRQKLNRIRPENFGQASRISGVSPADISVLMIYLRKQEAQKRAEKHHKDTQQEGQSDD